MFIIWYTWVIAINFWYNFSRRIVSKFNFFRWVLSIGARLTEESQGTFQFDSNFVPSASGDKVALTFEMYPSKTLQKLFNFSLLKSSKARRKAPT